jgi:hypothetical protein
MLYHQFFLKKKVGLYPSLRRKEGLQLKGYSHLIQTCPGSENKRESKNKRGALPRWLEVGSFLTQNPISPPPSREQDPSRTREQDHLPMFVMFGF